MTSWLFGTKEEMEKMPTKEKESKREK